MHITIQLGGGFHWKRFKCIVSGDPTMQNVEVPLRIQSSGIWPWRQYAVILPEKILFEEATFVAARLSEVIRQAKDPSIFQMGREHRISFSFSYDETEEDATNRQERDIIWNQDRAERALESFAGWWFERTGELCAMQTNSMAEQEKTVLVTNQATPSTVSRWTITDSNAEIVIVGTNAGTMEMLLNHMTQILSGSVWSGERHGW